MIPRPLSEIAMGDLVGLIESGRIEDQTIEYKRTYPGAGEDRSGILKTIAAFANTRGGDLIIGIEAAQGAPTAITGVTIDNPDGTTLALCQFIADSTEPPIRDVHIAYVPAEDGTHVVVIRAERSWAQPHRLKRGGEFHARGAANNYAMDLESVKRAFRIGDELTERARAFHSDRIATILDGSGPVRMHDNALLVVHIAPMSAFGNPDWVITPTEWRAKWQEFLPPNVTAGGYTYEFHADGFVSREVNVSGTSAAYTLTFRNGILEIVYWIGRIGRSDSGKFVPSEALETLLRGCMDRFPPLLQSFGLQTNFLTTFALLKAKGHGLGLDVFRDDAGRPFERNVYTFPWRTIPDLHADADSVIRTDLDALWNAAGIESSINYLERRNKHASVPR